MASKVLIVISRSDVAPRFDLAVEVLIAEIVDGAIPQEPRHLLLSEPSGDEFCALAVRESIDTVVCGGIDEVHFDYLNWKKISVIDGIIGPYETALEVMLAGELERDLILPGAASDTQVG